jgi:hypothetical protein
MINNSYETFSCRNNILHIPNRVTHSIPFEIVTKVVVATENIQSTYSLEGELHMRCTWARMSGYSVPLGNEEREVLLVRLNEKKNSSLWDFSRQHNGEVYKSRRSYHSRDKGARVNL